MSAQRKSPRLAEMGTRDDDEARTEEPLCEVADGAVDAGMLHAQ